jgi:hypothetical protein
MTSPGSVQARIDEVRERGYCVLRGRLAPPLVEACREAVWPRLLRHLARGVPGNRGPHRHFLPLPFEPPVPVAALLLDDAVLAVVRGLMDDRVVADQWGCDVPVRGSEHQAAHVDYQRPLFPESPDLALPPYTIVVSFGLVRIEHAHGPIEIAPGTHRLPRAEALRAVAAGEIGLEPVPLELGDVLVRHPWAVHRGTPNVTDVPRALATVRYVRRWYADASREVEAVPAATWASLSDAQRAVLRFPLADEGAAPAPG